MRPKASKENLVAFLAGFLLALALTFNPPALQNPEPSFQGNRTASTNIVAVSEKTGSGIVGEVETKIIPGSGKVLLETSPFVGTTTQLSAKKAKDVAEKITNTELKRKNVIYSFDVEGTVVGGPSAGAAMTISTIAAIKNEKLPDDFAVTGTIKRDGEIGRVGGVTEKAVAAGKAGLNTFYVPEDQSIKTYYDTEVSKDVLYPGIYTRDIEYVKKKFSVNNMTKEQYNMTTKEVNSVKELYNSLKD